MLKLLFSILLLANAALFAYQQGYLETLLPSGREPGRMSKQFNADKIRLVPQGTATGGSPAATAPAVPVLSTASAILVAAATNKPETLACTEIGNFNPDDAKRFEARLAALALGGRTVRRSIQEVTTHMVYIPSQGDRESAEKKAGELRRLGITDFYIIQDNSTMRWGISLGVFKLEEAARAHLAGLNQKGVRSARIGPRNVVSSMVAFQLHDLGLEMKTGLDKLKAEFPRQEMRTCDSAA